jgi:hypothetical protein
MAAFQKIKGMFLGQDSEIAEAECSGVMPPSLLAPTTTRNPVYSHGS